MSSNHGFRCVLPGKDLRNGLDLKRWVAEELDTLIPYTDCPGTSWEEEAAVRHFVSWSRGLPAALNGCRRSARPIRWNALRRLGHRGEIEKWRRLGEPGLAPASVPLRRVGDYDLTYQTPG